MILKIHFKSAQDTRTIHLDVDIFRLLKNSQNTLYVHCLDRLLSANPSDESIFHLSIKSKCFIKLINK